MHAASNTPEKTKAIAKTLLERIAADQNRSGAAVIALVGELGAGKTTLVQGLGSALGIQKRLLSPTFVLLRSTPVIHSLFAYLSHIDCYRLDHPEELFNLGLDEMLKDKRQLIVIEWADKIRSLLPEHTVWVTLEHGDEEGERRIAIETRN